jgi:hypothetical protein
VGVEKFNELAEGFFEKKYAKGAYICSLQRINALQINPLGNPASAVRASYMFGNILAKFWHDRNSCLIVSCLQPGIPSGVSKFCGELMAVLTWPSCVGAVLIFALPSKSQVSARKCHK